MNTMNAKTSSKLLAAGIDPQNACAIEFKDLHGERLPGIASALADKTGGVAIGSVAFFANEEARDRAGDYLNDHDYEIEGYYGHEDVSYVQHPVWADYDGGDLYVYYCA